MNDYSKITALYSRLSVGDEDRDGGESNSIVNQKAFLERYARDRNKIYDRKKRQNKCKSVPATDWNGQNKAEEWRAAWAQICNCHLEQTEHTKRIDHRSYERQRESTAQDVGHGAVTDRAAG